MCTLKRKSWKHDVENKGRLKKYYVKNKFSFNKYYEDVRIPIRISCVQIEPKHKCKYMCMSETLNNQDSFWKLLSYYLYNNDNIEIFTGLQCVFISSTSRWV